MPVARAHRGGLARPQEVEQRPHHEGRGGGEHRVREGQAGGGVGGQGTSRVEAEPPEPEQPRAQDREGHVVGKERLAAVVLARAEHERRHQGGRAGVDVHHGAAREVEGAHLGQPSAAPDPVRHGGVDEERPEGQEGQVGAEAHPLHDRARDEGGGDDREGALVGHEEQVRDRPLRLEIDSRRKTRERSPIRRAPGGKGERVAEQGPGHAHEPEGRHAHHQRVEGVLGAHQPAVEKAQRRGHQQHQGRRDKHPRHIGGDHESSSCLRVRPHFEQEACTTGRRARSACEALAGSTPCAGCARFRRASGELQECGGYRRDSDTFVVRGRGSPRKRAESIA